MKLAELYQQVMARLREGKIDEPALEARWLLAGRLGLNENKIWTEPALVLAPEQVRAIENDLKRRLNGEPLAYVLGEKEFYGRSFRVNAAVLVPRPETELIIDETLKYARGEPLQTVVDLGTGSGCLAVTLLCELPRVRALAIDSSAEALAVARQNAEMHQVADRLTLKLLDLQIASELPWREVDVVVANPPYIAKDDANVDEYVRQYEPATALFSGDGGFAHIKQWSRLAGEALRSGGLFLCEIGAGQADNTIKIIEDLKVFGETEFLRDLAGHPRTLRAIRR